MAAARIGVITVKGGVNRDGVAGGNTGKALQRARKANSEIRNLTLDAELKSIEMAMRRK